MLTTEGINASGLKVLSEEYSYPISTILTFLILPISLEYAFKFASVPFVLLTFKNSGSFL